MKLFWHCLYWHARPMALWLLFYNRIFFKRDFELIEHVAHASTGQEIQHALELYASSTFNSLSFCRGKLRVRLSGRRLFTLWKKVHPVNATSKAGRTDLLQEVA